ncbi:MAG TPA: multidrug transporter [Gammaproteobacteria bacterium]|nr:multidrug transporter [Gammaproteobacteria bacterium]
MTIDKLYLIIALALLLGLLLVGMGIRRLFGRSKFSGGFNIVFGVALVALAVGSVGILINLYTYQTLTGEQPVGSLRFEKFAQREYVATLDTGSGQSRQFTVFGDECQMDARILKWHYFANLIGFDTLYRLDRISGRYKDVAAEKTEKRSVYALVEDPGIEIWSLINRLNEHLPWIDAVYGNAVYLPMEQGAAYRITMTDSGLVARPENAAAEQAVQHWR